MRTAEMLNEGDVNVEVTRFLRGQPISQGDKDHSSHRLVILGLTEVKAVLLLYSLAAISGVTAVVIEWRFNTLGLILVPLVILSFALFTTYLARVPVPDKQ